MTDFIEPFILLQSLRLDMTTRGEYFQYTHFKMCIKSQYIFNFFPYQDQILSLVLSWHLHSYTTKVVNKSSCEDLRSTYVLHGVPTQFFII